MGNDDWQSRNDARVYLEQADPGDYLLLVSGYGNGDVGAFDLTVTLGEP